MVAEDMRGLFQEGERQALDRALACHLLQLVYDASPLVRAEVALALGRLVSGHAVFFQASCWLAPFQQDTLNLVSLSR